MSDAASGEQRTSFHCCAGEWTLEGSATRCFGEEDYGCGHRRVQSPQAVKPDGSICWALLAPEANILRTWHPAVAQRGLEPAPGREAGLPRWPAGSCSWSRSPAHTREDAGGPALVNHSACACYKSSASRQPRLHSFQLQPGELTSAVEPVTQRLERRGSARGSAHGGSSSTAASQATSTTVLAPPTPTAVASIHRPPSPPSSVPLANAVRAKWECPVYGLLHCPNKNAGFMMKIKCLGMDCSHSAKPF
ncbi:uncharacterized protein LOC132367666 [Balaenoptera ricei]|uniref:uncharacterized protein LOC132367666 n=1 Tax=Balaenoptera ricei TaxID=2746895 RepID=UPI0028BF2FD4|nr:uncharacterized protein LOC132367666 [Balaenoptera ricei]